MFGSKSLDAGSNIFKIGGVIASPIDKIGEGLSRPVYATSSQVIKPLDKTSFEFYKLFRNEQTFAMNVKSSTIQKLP